MPNSESGGALRRAAHAKVNLMLGVGPRRSDGFHEIDSLVLHIDLHDTVIVSPRDNGQIVITCDDPTIPCDETNLVARAARALQQETGTQRGAQFHIEKRIPAGAGLGGGSSDAAAALQLLNRLWELHLPLETLRRIGARIGSDVAMFFQTAQLSHLSGRGEIVRELDLDFGSGLVLFIPPYRLNTAEVYAAFDRLPAVPLRHSAEKILEESVLQYRDGNYLIVSALDAYCYNDLVAAAFEIRPELRALIKQIKAATGSRVHMSGSGSTLFTIGNSVRDCSMENGPSRGVRVIPVRPMARMRAEPLPVDF